MKYGNWEPTGCSERRRGELYLECKCTCGTTRFIRKIYLDKKTSKSCGCMKATLISKARTVHGHSGKSSTASRTYNSWRSMIVRCTDSKHTAYHNYGGRGIRVCARWFVFVNFLEDMGERPDGTELDRKDNTKNYCKSNCRWVTRSINTKNTRLSKIWVIEGRQYNASREAAEAEGVTRATIRRWCLGYAPNSPDGVIAPKKDCYCYSKY